MLLGTGTAGLGDRDDVVEPGGTVSDEQLRRLLGQGRGPITKAPRRSRYYRHKTVQERICGERLLTMSLGTSSGATSMSPAPTRREACHGRSITDGPSDM